MPVVTRYATYEANTEVSASKLILDSASISSPVSWVDRDTSRRADAPVAIELAVNSAPRRRLVYQTGILVVPSKTPV